MLPGLAQQNHPSRCDPALIKVIARGRAWVDELATGRVRSPQDSAKRDGITRRYIRRLVGLAFLSPDLVETILQGRQPAAKPQPGDSRARSRHRFCPSRHR